MIHLIIDGYNYIGRRKGLRGDLETKRKRLQEELSSYHRMKGYPITVVFDGWRSGWETEHEEWTGGISVIFSRKGERADTVITRLARQMGGSCVVVSSDREVQRGARECGAGVIFSGEFEDRLNAALASDAIPPRTGKDESEDDLVEKPRFGRKKGNPFRRSRAERKRLARLRKL